MTKLFIPCFSAAKKYPLRLIRVTSDEQVFF